MTVNKVETPYQKYISLNQKYDLIEKQRNIHFDLYEKINTVNNKNIYITDNFIISVLKRSLDLSDAFVCMVDKWNFTISGALLRMQIDSLLRLHYIKQRNDAEFLKEYFSGKSFREIKHVNGEKLTDSILVKLAKPAYPWIENVYKETSTFIHLSSKYFNTMIVSMNYEENSIETFFGVGFPHWKEESLKEILDAFSCTTDAILKIVDEWITMKSNFPPI